MSKSTKLKTPTRSIAVHVVLWLALWSIAAVVVQRSMVRGDVLLPGPWDVVTAVPGMNVFHTDGADSGALGALSATASHTLSSLMRLLSGVVIGVGIGILLGLLLGASPLIRRVAEGSVHAIRAIPNLALIPLFLGWFGSSNVGSIAFIAFGAFAIMVVSTIEAITHVNPMQQRFATTLGASRVRVFRTVVLPAIIPELTGSIRVVIGVSWALLLAAEFLAAQNGLGRVLILAQQYSMTSRMLLVVVIIIGLTVALDRLFAAGAARVTAWVPR